MQKSTRIRVVDLVSELDELQRISHVQKVCTPFAARCLRFAAVLTSTE